MSIKLLLTLTYLVGSAFTDRFELRVPYESIDDVLVIKLGIGDPEQTFKVAISTTESISWIHSTDCKNCLEVLFEKEIDEDEDGRLRFLQSNSTSNSSITSNNSTSNQSENKTSEDRYHSEKSKTSVFKNKTVKVETVDGSLEGRLYSELVSIDKIKGAEYFFVGTSKVKDWTTLFKYNGVLGLSYTNINGADYDFLLNLKKHNNISKRIFSIGNGELYIGEYPTEVMQFPSKYNTCNLTLTEGLKEEYRDGWVCDISHIVFGKTSNFTEAVEIQGRAIFDSAYSKIVAPIEFFSQFKENYFDDLNNCTTFVNDEEDDDYTYVSCDKTDAISDISLVFGGYGLIIPGSKIFTIKDNKMVSNFAFSQESKNFWRIGRLILDEYLVVYDSETSVVGFFGDSKLNFYKEWKQWWNLGSGTITAQEHFKYLVIASIALGSALMLVIVCLIIQSFRSKKEDERAPLEEDKE